MRILVVGDVVGRPGRRALEAVLNRVVSDHGVEFVIANGENAAGGMGITPAIAKEMFNEGIDVLTSGNHIWAKKEIIPFLDEEKRILRPANYPEGAPGKGAGVFESKLGEAIGVLNLEGRVFMKTLDCPFRVAERELGRLKKETNVVIVDFHAEATSEKVAMGRFLDGRVSAVLGTHTHVQTNDPRILDRGTAYMTDVGMTGPMASVIGVREELALGRFLAQMPWKYDVATGEIELQGVVLAIDPDTGKAKEIEKVKVPLRELG